MLTSHHCQGFYSFGDEAHHHLHTLYTLQYYRHLHLIEHSYLNPRNLGVTWEVLGGLLTLFFFLVMVTSLSTGVFGLWTGPEDYQKC